VYAFRDKKVASVSDVRFSCAASLGCFAAYGLVPTLKIIIADRLGNAVYLSVWSESPYEQSSQRRVKGFGSDLRCCCRKGDRL
jgi:hypothetical protein